MDQPAPRTIGRYEIEVELGRGGMGVVYLARDAALQRKVAVKVLADHAFDSSSARELFLNEARVAASLDEPYVIPIYEVGRITGFRI